MPISTHSCLIATNFRPTHAYLDAFHTKFNGITIACAHASKS